MYPKFVFHKNLSYESVALAVIPKFWKVSELP